MSLMEQALNKAQTGMQTGYSDSPKACKLHLSLLIYTRQHSTYKYEVSSLTLSIKLKQTY